MHTQSNRFTFDEPRVTSQVRTSFELQPLLFRADQGRRAEALYRVNHE